MKTATVIESDVMRLLNEVVDPCSIAAGMPLGLPDMGLISGVDIDQGHLQVRVRLSSPSCYMLGYFTDEIRERLTPLAGVETVDVEFDEGFEWDESFMSPEVQERRRRTFLQLDTRARNTGSVRATSSRS